MNPPAICPIGTVCGERDSRKMSLAVMGWSNTAMAARYQHVMATLRHNIATRVGGLLAPRRRQRTPGPSQKSAGTEDGVESLDPLVEVAGAPGGGQQRPQRALVSRTAAAGVGAAAKTVRASGLASKVLFSGLLPASLGIAGPAFLAPQARLTGFSTPTGVDTVESVSMRVDARVHTAGIYIGPRRPARPRQ
jgi:hypothetical protein